MVTLQAHQEDEVLHPVGLMQRATGHKTRSHRRPPYAILCRELGNGSTEASGICFKIDSEDAQPVTIRPGQDILIRMEAGLGVAKVLAILQVQSSGPGASEASS